MDKLKMAHDFAMNCLKSGLAEKIKDLGIEAWCYADAMQAEAKKREQEASEKASKEIKDILENHEHVFIDGRICWCGKIKSDIEEEWQPDWSQAPVKTVAWHKTEFNECEWILEFGGKLYHNGKAPDFGYIGNWQDSWRKRP